MTSPANSQPAVWCNKHEAATIVGLSESSLKKLRLNNQLVEGIHGVRYSSRCVRYNVELLKDWAMNRNNTQLHNQAIANHLSALPSYQLPGSD